MREQLPPFLDIPTTTWLLPRVGWDHDLQRPVARGSVDKALTGVTVERGSIVGEEGWKGSPEEVFRGFPILGVVVVGLRGKRL